MSNAVRSIQKLFVGNLPWTVGQKELKLYFSKFGHIQTASVIFDKATGMSRGYAFVTFSTRDGFNSASNKTNHVLDGRVLNVQVATS
ncbi:SRA stem-loop-interacting RNA-binding protein, mitochondrial [Hermetia illucens]|uniref:SRA stem-loop-interacting RNA-binding protein, mitochondrial n=1 Tax=Hermetia illucens TaxID=343691 RepID=UPI0018CC39BB|nr:SRA stem-loop-interacting RNA-binding protein, mitochondrial [Hermetia illucens]